MYCKFCGSRIMPNAAKCVSCGAKIDLTDGGQSFFDDGELDAWKEDSLLQSPPISVPKTEMREPLHYNIGLEKEYEMKASRPQATTSTRRSHSRGRSKKKKNLLDYFHLSSSTKLIIFCISSALAIVLLVVAIIAVLNSDNEKDENVISDSVHEQQISDDSFEQNSYQQNSQINQENPIYDKDNSKVNETEKGSSDEAKNGKEEIKDIKIYIDNKEISHPVSAYLIDNKIYVSLGKILKNEGYWDGRPNGNYKDRVIYEHPSGKIFEIKKESSLFWTKEANEGNEKSDKLETPCFTEGSEIYVPARSFLNKIGYSNVKYDPEKQTLTVNK